MRFVSLGPTCETRWQLTRLQGASNGHSVFDWQITDFDALMFCLSGNFERSFVKDLLTVSHGCVRDIRFEAVYPHAFGGEPVAPDAVNVHFATEKLKRERRIARFREALAGPEPVTLVRCERLSARQIVALTLALRRLGARNIDLVVLGDDIPAYLLPDRVVSRSFNPRVAYHERWQGDDAEWDAAMVMPPQIV